MSATGPQDPPRSSQRPQRGKIQFTADVADDAEKEDFVSERPAGTPAATGFALGARVALP